MVEKFLWSIFFVKKKKKRKNNPSPPLTITTPTPSSGSLLDHFILSFANLSQHHQSQK
jgi:hypothetical protein